MHTFTEIIINLADVQLEVVWYFVQFLRLKTGMAVQICSSGQKCTNLYTQPDVYKLLQLRLCAPTPVMNLLKMTGQIE